MPSRQRRWEPPRCSRSHRRPSGLRLARRPHDVRAPPLLGPARVREPERVDEETGVAVGAMPPIRYRSQLAECREQLRHVASDSGGAQVAAMVDEAKLLRATLVLASGSPLGASSSALIP